MSDPRENLVALDAKLGRAWAKIEILLGLIATGVALCWLDALALRWNSIPSLIELAGAFGLFTLGGYLTLAGHRSHLYRWSNRNTVVLIDEIRRLKDTLQDKGQPR